MTMDLENKTEVSNSIDIAAITDGTLNGTGVELTSHGALVVFTVGTKTDGTHTPKLQDSPDNSTWADVAAADQVGTLAALASDTHQKVGYVGSERYLRAVITTTGSTTGIVAGAVVVKQNPRKGPV